MHLLRFASTCVYASLALYAFSCAVDKKRTESFRLVNSNLYCDDKGNLAIKTQDVSSLENGAGSATVRWLEVAYCEACTLVQKGETIPGLASLKDLIDTASFKHTGVDEQQGADLYEDKKYHYFHKWMADGGTITCIPKQN